MVLEEMRECRHAQPFILWIEVQILRSCREMKTLPFICPNSLFGEAVIVSLVYNTQKYNELRVKKPISRCEFESCFGHHPTKASVEAGKGYLLFVG